MDFTSCFLLFRSQKIYLNVIITAISAKISAFFNSSHIFLLVLIQLGSHSDETDTLLRK